MKDKSTSLEILLVSLIMILSFFIRYPFLQQSNKMPINDGGMFYVMTNELIENHFSIPKVTEYNHSSIPYTYPPLAFYCAGLLHTAFGVDVLDVERVLPLIFNLAGILFFYWLAKELLQGKGQALVATIAFSISSTSFEWLIMGGGLARSPAYAFSILALYLLLHGIKNHRWKFVIAAGIICGLTFGFHIETGYFTFILFIFTILYYARNRFGILALISSIVLCALLYGPLFLMAVLQNGLQPYFYAMRGGAFNLLYSLGFLLKFDFFDTTPFIDVAGVLAFIGLFFMLKKKNFYVPVWLLLVCVFEARSSSRFGVIPVSILFSYAVYELIISRLPKTEFLFHQPLFSSNNVIALLCSLPVFLSVPAIYVNESPLLNSLTTADQQAMQWVKASTPATSNFAVIPATYWHADMVSEWFPALTDRASVLTVQGTEWTDEFIEREEKTTEFIKAIQRNDFDAAIKQTGKKVDYLYCSLNHQNLSLAYCPDEIQNFMLVYDQGDVKIYQATEK